MELSPAIQRHRKPLLRIVAMMFGMIGLAEGATVERLSKPLYRAVLRVLRPAESAVRRLIVVAARSLTLKAPAARAAIKAASRGDRKGYRRPISFRLFDPRQRFSSAFANERPRHRIRVAVLRRPEPRVRVIGYDPRVPWFRAAPVVAPQVSPVVVEDGMVSAVRLSRRLIAIRSALEDLPRQARRYARWQAQPLDKRRPQLASALRPGVPPGHRKTPVQEIDEILNECDWLAREARQPDSS